MQPSSAQVNRWVWNETLAVELLCGLRQLALAFWLLPHVLQDIDLTVERHVRLPRDGNPRPATEWRSHGNSPRR